MAKMIEDIKRKLFPSYINFLYPAPNPGVIYIKEHLNKRGGIFG
jgi:hypothetical protein